MLCIDKLTSVDIEIIADIDRQNHSPWTKAQFLEELRLAHGWSLGAWASGSVVGYVFGTTVVDEAEIRKVAVLGEYRRQGIARQLLEAAFKQLRLVGVGSCFLELRASNLAAYELYRRSGFLKIGMRHKYYAAPLEDAVLLQRVITGEEHKRT